MKVFDFISDVAQRASQTLTQAAQNDETIQDVLRRQFNLFHKDFNKRYFWPWREKKTFIQTVANYTAGTVAVTNGSRTVTGNGTTFTSAMVGRIFKLNQESELYEILSVTNGTTFVLRTPYLGDSASAQSYLIWKKYYELDPDVPYLSDITVGQWPYTAKEIPKKSFDGNIVRGWQTNSLNLIWTWGGIDRSIVNYSGEGTVSVTKDSQILTGVTTTFLDSVFGGSKITVGTNVYNAESVDSNTQITMVQKAITTVSGTASFSIQTKNRCRIQLSSVPDPRINLLIVYPKRTFDFGLEDEPEIWEGHEHIITDVMYGYLLEKLTSEKAFAWYDIYRSKIKEAWINLNERDSIEQVPRIQRQTLSGYRPSLYG